jgi:hypothetical protein
MSERTRGEGNNDAPKVDANEVRSGNGNAESGTRRVGDARREHEEDRKRRENELGTSWASVVFGWLAALGAGLILSGIVGAVVGGILGALGVKGGTEGGIAGIVGLLVTLFLAFLIGGYVSGRLASRSGFKHGILVPVLSLVVILVLAIVGAVVGASLIDQLSGIALPQVPGGVQKQAPQSLGTILTVSGIVALLAPLIAGALGGLWGAKTGRDRP